MELNTPKDVEELIIFCLPKKIRVHLDSGSDGDIWFHLEKELPNAFPTLKGRLYYYNTSAGKFHTKGKAKFVMKFSEFSESKQYTIIDQI